MLKASVLALSWFLVLGQIDQPKQPPAAPASTTANPLERLSAADRKRLEEYAKTCKLAPDGAIWSFQVDDDYAKHPPKGSDPETLKKLSLYKAADAPRWYDVDNDRRATDMASVGQFVAAGANRANLPDDVRSMGMRFVPTILVRGVSANSVLFERVNNPALDSEWPKGFLNTYRLLKLPASFGAVEGKQIDVNMEMRYIRSEPAPTPHVEGIPVYEFVRSIDVPKAPAESEYKPVDAQALAQHMIDHHWEGLVRWEIRRGIVKPAEAAKRVPSVIERGVIKDWVNVPAKPAEYGYRWEKTVTPIKFGPVK